MLSGKCHSSKSNFVSRDRIEQQADEFAASLLMPMELFRHQIRTLRSSVASLTDLCRLAEERFQTSITSTVRRYCQSDVEPCAVVFSRNRIVQWCQFSEDMRLTGMGFIPFGSQIPAGTVTQELLEKGIKKIEGAVDPWRWFDSPRYRGKLWEEAMTLGSSEMVLTYLTYQ